MTEPIHKRVVGYDAGRKGYSKKLSQFILNWNAAMGRRSILDIGTGTGIFLADIAKHFKSAKGTDLSPDRIEFAQKKYKKIKFAVESGNDIKSKDHSIDLLTAAQCFHYLDRKLAIPEFKRVLRSNGTLAILWKYPDIASAPMIAINQAVDEINNTIGKQILRKVPNGSESVRNETLIKDLVSGGFSRVAYQEFPITLEFNRSEVHALGIHSVGFATQNLDYSIENLFLKAIDHHLGKGKKWKMNYMEHAYLGSC